MLTELLELIGIVALVVGACMIHLGLGVILFGVLLLATAQAMRK